MHLADLIYQKSKNLPDDYAAEIIYFIEYLQNRYNSENAAAKINCEETTRKSIIHRLSKIRIQWDDKPISNRDTMYDDSRS